MEAECGGKSHWKRLGSGFTQRYFQHEAAPLVTIIRTLENVDPTNGDKDALSS
jgi:hypothetical protein